MILDTKHKQQSFCKQPAEWWIYATPFNSYTRKFGFERDSASPATNLAARHCKNIYSMQWIQGTLFFRASASCSNILNVNSIFNTVKNIREKYVFQGKRRVAQKSWMVRNVFSIQWKLSEETVFQGKRKFLKNPEHWKYFGYSVFSAYSLGGDPCNLG